MRKMDAYLTQCPLRVHSSCSFSKHQNHGAHHSELDPAAVHSSSEEVLEPFSVQTSNRSVFCASLTS